MKDLGLYLGCVIPTEQYGYEMSIREVIPEFDINLIDIENVSCCGAPLRSVNLMMQLYLSARNIALCESKDMDMYAPCPQCHLSLMETIHRLNNSDVLRDKIVKKLRDYEGLTYTGDLTIYHTLDLLYDEIGLERIKKKVKKSLDWNIACHYGCHTVRYSDLKRPDRAEHPSKMEEIIRVLGAKTNDYSEKLNCCGAPLLITHKDSALTKAGEKLKAIKERHFDATAIVCPFGGRMLDSSQEKAGKTIGEKLEIPVFYLTQLIGLSMKKQTNNLGIHLNLSSEKLFI